MSNKTVVNVRGVGCLTMVGLIFVTLKLCGVIDWAWVWVLSPFIFQFGLVGIALVAILIFTVFAFIVYLIEELF